MKTRFITLLILVIASLVSAQTVMWQTAPKKYQLFPRDLATNKATIPFSGWVGANTYDSIGITILRNGHATTKRIGQKLTKTANQYFSVNMTIPAECAEYSFKVELRGARKKWVAVTQFDSILAGDVYLIAGQSNAVIGNNSVTWKNQYCRTFGIYTGYNEPAGNSTENQWYISSGLLNNRNPVIGVWPLEMSRLLTEYSNVPVCIINGAMGGTTIEQNQKGDLIYTRMLDRANMANVASKARAIFWYQGEANTATNYLTNFTSLYNNWKTDYPNLEKVYVFQIRPGCNTGTTHLALRELQRTLGSSFSDIQTLPTVAVEGHDGCHSSVSGYNTLAAQVFPIVARDFYSHSASNINAPNIRSAWQPDSVTVIIRFGDGNVLSSTANGDVEINGVITNIKKSFYLDGSNSNTSSIQISNDSIFLRLATADTVDYVTYVPDKYYDGTTKIYEGPWIINQKGIGALTFHNFPVSNPMPSFKLSVSPAEIAQFSVYPNPVSQSKATLTVNASTETAGQISIANSSGQTLQSFSVDLVRGYNGISLDFDRMPDGVYFVKIAYSGHVFVKSVIKQ